MYSWLGFYQHYWTYDYQSLFILSLSKIWDSVWTFGKTWVGMLFKHRPGSREITKVSILMFFSNADQSAFDLLICFLSIFTGLTSLTLALYDQLMINIVLYFVATELLTFMNPSSWTCKFGPEPGVHFVFFLWHFNWWHSKIIQVFDKFLGMYVGKMACALE